MLEDAGLDFKVSSSDVDEDILKQQMVGMPYPSILNTNP